MKVKCEVCGKLAYKEPWKLERNLHNFCSRECFSIWRSKLVGNKSPNFKNAKINYICEKCGNKFSGYTKNRKYCSIECKKLATRERYIRECYYCGNQYELRKSEIKVIEERGYKHNFCSKECKNKYYSGMNNYMWLDDRNLLKDQSHSIRESKEMKDWRKQVFERDDWTCQECDKRGIELNAHHIKQFAKYPELRFNINNGVTLCKLCHRRIHHIK